MANEFNKGVDRLFENRLEGASVPPPSGLWNNISTELENDRLRRKVVYWRLVAAATILLFLGVGLWTAAHLTSVDHQVMLADGSSGSSISFPDRGAPAFTPQQEIPCAILPHHQERIAAHVKAATRIPAASAARVRSALRTVRQDQMQPVRKAAQIPVLASLTPRQLGSPGGLPLHEALLQEDSRQPIAVVRPEAVPVMSDDPKPALNPAKGREILAWTEDEEPAKDKKGMRWTLGGSFSPDVAFSTQTPVQSSAARISTPTLPDDPAKASRSLSDPVATYSTGLRAALDMGERISLRTGLLYSRRNTSKSYLTNAYGVEESYANNFSVGFLEIPLSMQYDLIHGKHFDYYISTGVSGSLLLGYEQELQTSQGRVASKKVSNEEQLFAPAQANLLLSTGIQYRAFDRMSFNLEPGVRYGFLTSDYAFARQDPISLSLMSGVNFHF